MLVFDKPVRVDSRTSIGDFVAGRLGSRSNGQVALDQVTVDALSEEIWSSEANTHLHQGDRRHARTDGKTSSLELLPDEWIYLPMQDVDAPDWQLQFIEVDTDNAATACTDVSQWALENGVLLPPVSGADPNGPPSIDAEVLKSYLFNSALRQGLTATNAYFYFAQQGSSSVDAAPTTPTGGSSQTNGVATPAWFLGFWHYIDRILDESRQHSRAFNALHDIISDGKTVVGLVDVLDRLMSVMDRVLAPPPPATGVFGRAAQAFGAAYSPDHGLTQDIADVHAKVRALRATAESDLVDNPTYPEVKNFQNSLARLSKIENEDAFKTLYAAFDAERQKYPATEQAFQVALAAYVQARTLDPSTAAVSKPFLDAFISGVAGASPMTQEIAKVFTADPKKKIDDATAIAMLTVGGPPGPPSLWVVLTRLSFISSLRDLAVAPAKNKRGNARVLKDYVEKLATASGVPKEKLQEWENRPPQRAQTPSSEAKATAARVAAAEEVAAATQSGPKFMAALSVMNLWAIYSAFGSTEEDVRKALASPDDAARCWLDAGSDAVGGAAAGANLTADVASLAVTGAKAEGALRAVNLLEQIFKPETVSAGLDRVASIAKVAGDVAGFAALALGALQIAQGLAAKDGVDRWKVAQGAGSIAIGIGYWLDVLVSRRAAQFVVEQGVKWGIGEIATVAVGETVLLALGSIVTVAGILITIVAIAATHWDEIMAVLTAWATPGTRKFCEGFLKQLNTCHAVKAGPSSVRDAVDAALQASAKAVYVTWAAPDSELAGLGLGESDLTLFKSIPVLVGAAGVP